MFKPSINFLLVVLLITTAAFNWDCTISARNPCRYNVSLISLLPFQHIWVMSHTKLLLALRHDQGWIHTVRIDGRWGMSSFFILNEEINILCFSNSSFTQYQMKTRLNNFSYLSWSLKKCMPMTISRHTSPMLARYSIFLIGICIMDCCKNHDDNDQTIWSYKSRL